jgi:hypothetical protein
VSFKNRKKLIKTRKRHLIFRMRKNKRNLKNKNLEEFFLIKK